VTYLKTILEVSVDPADDINLTYPYTADDNLPDVYFMTVHTRAVEIFIESSIMDPLRSLSNVDLATVCVLQPWTGNEQKLQPKYDDMLRELEEGIDLNWSPSSNTESSSSPRASDSPDVD
jgi:hypothetical protein